MRKTIQLTSSAAETPRRPLSDCASAGIRTDAVYVVFTSIEATLAAVRVAGDFANALGVPVTLLHFRTVPYALPLEEPCGNSPVETDAFLARLEAEDLDVRVRVSLCRDERQAVQTAFRGQSLVVVGGRRRRWPTASGRWRRLLEAAGHLVVFVDTSEPRRAGRLRAGGVPAIQTVIGRTGPGSLCAEEKERPHA